MDLLTILSCPMCAAVVVLLGLFVPKLLPKILPVLVPLLTRLLGRTPAKPNTPVDPNAPAQPEQPRPMLDLLKLLINTAKNKFPNLTEQEAVERFAVQQRYYHYLEAEAKERDAQPK